ncbi:MAG: hypothetical protein ACETVY_05630 [Candidatus Bathyarchaeia archaeon]
MGKTQAVMVGLATVAIGLGVPAACLYATIFYGFHSVTAAIVAIAGIIIGGGIGVVGIVLGPLGQTFDDTSRVDRERLRAMRAHQRTTLEEMDDIVAVLGEIRDVLKAVEE